MFHLDYGMWVLWDGSGASISVGLHRHSPAGESQKREKERLWKRSAAERAQKHSGAENISFAFHSISYSIRKTRLI